MTVFNNVKSPFVNSFYSGDFAFEYIFTKLNFREIN
jgi:hypothetical protein